MSANASRFAADLGQMPAFLSEMLLSLEAAFNSVLHTLPAAPFPAMASLIEDPLLLKAYRNPPATRPLQLNPKVAAYLQQHNIQAALSTALNAVMAARPAPAEAIGALAEELRRQRTPAGAAASTPVSPEEAELQLAIQHALGALNTATERECESALAHLVESKQGDKARELIKKMGNADRPIDESTYLPLLTIAQQHGDWRETIGMLVHAKEMHTETGMQSYSLTLTACAQARETRACHQLLEQMAAKKLAISPEAADALATAGLACSCSDELLKGAKGTRDAVAPPNAGEPVSTRSIRGGRGRGRGRGLGGTGRGAGGASAKWLQRSAPARVPTDPAHATAWLLMMIHAGVHMSADEIGQALARVLTAGPEHAASAVRMLRELRDEGQGLPPPPKATCQSILVKLRQVAANLPPPRLEAIMREAETLVDDLTAN